MARPDAAALLPLAESIADGSAIDWHVVEAGASAEDQAMIRQLRILAELATLHRTLPSNPSTLPNRFSAQRASAAPAIGRWAHLDLIERIGGGTFGDVYRAWDRHLEREVALKLLRTDQAVADPQSSRIIAEGRLLARVQHLNVVTVHGVAVHDGRVGLWMELVHGATLEQILSKQGPFSAREATLVGIDLCRALAAIHKARLIHRDVKAQNVLREDGGRIVLMDLGTGREITPAGHETLPDLAGTPLYLPPERFEGEPATERTDLFSLGVLLYHLVTGSFPVRATTIDELKAAHAQGERTRLRDARPDLPTAFVHVVDRAIASDQGERYASAGALEADLVKALDDVSLSRPSVQGMRHFGRRAWWRRPSRRALSVGALLAVTAFLIALALYRFGPSAPKPGPRSDGKIELAVLPVQNLTGQTEVGTWPELIQALFVGELAGVHDVAIMDPLSMNAMLASKLGAAPPRRNTELFALMQRVKVSFVIDGTIMRAGGGRYDIRINLVDPVSAQTRFPARVAVGSEEELADGVRSLAQGILGFLQLQGLQLANDKDLRPWISLRRQNIQAVNAFLQASQYIFRYERVAGERYLRRAIELDPTFIEPRVWLIPGLVEDKPEEARQHYDALLMLDANASPFEQAMIAFAGAVLNGDSVAQARQLEIALDYLPGNNILLMNLAESREANGDCAGALDAMRSAIDMRWRYPPMYEVWGWCSIQAGHFTEARHVLLDAVTMPAVHPNLYAILDGLAIVDGDLAAADRYDALHIARERELDRPAPSNYIAKVYAQLGSYCLSRGQYDRASRLFSKAVAAEPKVADHYRHLADALQKLGDARQAERIEQRLRELEAGRR